jgi:ATP-dependent protease ClpP protease subunit
MAWRIQNANAKEVDVDLFDIIGDPWDGTTAQDFVKELRGLKNVDRINLHINSPGGYVNDALAMYAAIQQHPAFVSSMVESEAASAASFVAMAGNEVLIAKNAKIMIHDAHGFVIGNAKDMRALADMLDEESNNIASIYAEKAGGTTEDWRSAMQANEGMGSTYRGQDAVDSGLADGLLSIKNEDLARIAALSRPQEDDTPDLPKLDLSSIKREPPAPSLESLLKKYPPKLEPVGGKQ